LTVLQINKYTKTEQTNTYVILLSIEGSRKVGFLIERQIKNKIKIKTMEWYKKRRKNKCRKFEYKINVSVKYELESCRRRIDGFGGKTTTKNKLFQFMKTVRPVSSPGI
jgi:hypothetical protein